MKHQGTIMFWAGLAAALIAGWRLFPLALHERPRQPLEFSHAVHREKAGMKCEDCHAVRADGTFSGIPGIGTCAGCHSQPAGTSEAEKRLIERYVTPNREIPWLVYARQPENVCFPHAVHVKRAGLACERCHGAQASSSAPRTFARNRISGYAGGVMEMSACESCHREKGVADSCLACHK